MEELVKIMDGKAVTTSLKVAEVFEKEHWIVLRSIRELEVPEEFAELNFKPGSYKDKNQQDRPMYYITRDGFVILAMGFTGKKAMQFKLAYIDAFNKMEAQIKGESVPAPAQLPDLIESTTRMLESLNIRLTAGENIPGHILKYAWNMANLTRTKSIITPEYPEFDFLNGIEKGRRYTRAEVYQMYCDQTENPMSPRRFWPAARKAHDFNEIKVTGTRCVIFL